MSMVETKVLTPLAENKMKKSDLHLQGQELTKLMTVSFSFKREHLLFQETLLKHLIRREIQIQDLANTK